MVFTAKKMRVAETGNVHMPWRCMHHGIYQLLINDHYLQTLF